jgi:hypothetical protein
MKRLILLMLICPLLLLIGCSNSSYSTSKIATNDPASLNFSVPTGSITVYKNYVLGESISSIDTYFPNVINNPELVESIINNLNQIYYEPTEILLDIWGYIYLINFDDISLQIVNRQYFYLDGTLFEITSGDLRFLDELGWQAKE